ncbi:MAG: hypothetical protein IH600_02605 [Bacteroidetes bacterium]|nr:hypothetical protein [Bacteroidota bacterium]
MISQSLPSKPPVAWALAFTALIIAATLFGGCSEPLAPVLPEWDIDANMPLINHTYTMQEMLQETDMLRITQDGDQVLVVTQRYPVDAISLADHLRINDYEFRASETFDVVHFEIPDYLDQQLNVFTLFPDLPKGQQTVGSIRNDLGVSIAIDTREYFEEMVFAKGKLGLDFINSTPVPLRLENIRLLDAGGSTLGQTSYANLIQPGQRITLPSMKLDGLKLTNNMHLAFNVSSPGSGGKMVDVTSAMSLGVKGELAETDILSVRGFVPSQDLSYSRIVNITNGSGLRVRDGLVRTGSLQFTVNNYFNVGADVAVTVLSASKAGAPVSATAHVNPKSTKTISVDLAGASLLLQNETDISYSAHIVTDDATATAVYVHRDDSVAVTGRVKDVYLASMTGTLAPTTLRVRKMETSDFKIDKTLAGSIKLSEARMWAQIRNDALLPVGVTSATVLGKNTTGSSASLGMAPFDIAGKSQSTVQFENAQVVSFLNSFSPKYPDSLGLEGEFVLNPTHQYGSATDQDHLTGDLYIEFPMRFTQMSGSVLDTVAMVIDEDTRRKLTEVNEGTLSFDLENHLPTDVTIEPEFLDSRYRTLFAPVSADGTPLHVGAAPVDGNGFVSRSVIEKLVMQFTGEDFAQLSKAAFIRFRISFNANNSGGSFRTTDYVRVRGYARLNVSTAITEK